MASVIFIKEVLIHTDAVDELTVEMLMNLLRDCDPDATVSIRAQGKDRDTTPLIAIEDDLTEVRLVV